MVPFWIQNGTILVLDKRWRGRLRSLGLRAPQRGSRCLLDDVGFAELIADRVRPVEPTGDEV